MTKDEKNAYMRNYYHTTECVVYGYLDDNDDIVYIGSTNNLEKRDSEHLQGKTLYFDQHYNNKSDFKLTILYKGKTVREIREVEKEQIEKFAPKYNITGIKNKVIDDDYIYSMRKNYLTKQEMNDLISQCNSVLDLGKTTNNEVLITWITKLNNTLKVYANRLYPKLYN